ncbi:MAG TPA: hypothetical protein VKR38_08680 [Usitatibacter sp.]|nr:hypothetical protein [Usitatibacter sp.]
MATPAKAPDNVAAWFEIPAADFGRAVGFYEKVFATRLIRHDMMGGKLAVFPYERPSMSGCVIEAEGLKPGRDGCLIYLETQGALDGPLARVVAAGGKVDTPKTALPEGMGFFAHFVDSEGNRVGLHSIE